MTATLTANKHITQAFTDAINANFTALSNTQVAGLSDLKALTAAYQTGIVLTQYKTSAGDGLSGVWVWRSGDQSANVTADPTSVDWAAPNSAPTGAGGAWQRQRPSLITNTRSSDLGPAGAALTPYGQTYGYNYASAGGSTHNAQIHFALGSVSNVAGSGTFGPASMDAASFSSIQKTSYLTSAVEGEVNASVSVAYQGAKGDVAAYLAEARKVKGSGSDTGSVLGVEAGFSWVNSSGTITQTAHCLVAFGESAGGVSGGQGYGFYSESWGNPGGTSSGQLFAAYYAGTYDAYGIGSGTSFGTKHVLYATTGRSTANRYFDILGDVVTGSQQPGDIIQGLAGNSKIFRTTSGGIFQIRNDADSATLFSLTNAGAAGFGVGSGTATVAIDGGASGAADGAAIMFKNAGVTKAQFGNGSTITGAGYTTDFALYLVSGGFDLYTAGAKTLTVSTAGALGVVGAATILNATAIPAGGTAGSGYKFSSTANFGVFFGSGAPTLSAAKGSLYLRSDGSATNNRAYINTDGSTTWTALTTVA